MTSDRFMSISGLLTTRPERKAATVRRIDSGPSDSAADQLTESVEASLPNRAQKRQPKEASKSREAAGGNRRVVFKVAPELHARLVEHARRTGLSHGNIVLDAVEEAYASNTLAQIVASSKRQTADGRTSLFARTAPREVAASSVTVEIQLRAQAVDQLDHLVAECNAENRTQLLNAALREHLN